MTCIPREQDLLLLAHGALPLPRRLLTQMHLRRCASCQERYGRLQNASYALAGGVRGPKAALWSPALNNASAGSRLSHFQLSLLLAFIALVTVVTLYMVVNGAISRRHSASRPPSVPSQGCAPGLPNDQCR